MVPDGDTAQAQGLPKALLLCRILGFQAQSLPVGLEIQLTHSLNKSRAETQGMEREAMHSRPFIELEAWGHHAGVWVYARQAHADFHK